jgi:hypothetical protein
VPISSCTIAINVRMAERIERAKKAQEGHAGCEFGVRIGESTDAVYHGPYRDQPAINCLSYKKDNIIL